MEPSITKDKDIKSETKGDTDEHDVYRTYRRKEGGMKTTTISNISFELPDHFEIIDMRTFFSNAFHEHQTFIPVVLSRKWSVRSCCGSERSDKARA